MAFRDVWVGRWNAEGLEFLEWCALTNRRICWVAFFSSSSFFFLFSFRRGVTGNFLEMGFTSGLTSRVKYLSKLFSWNRFFLPPEKFGLLFFRIFRFF